MPIDPYWRKALDAGYRSKHAAKDAALKRKAGKRRSRPNQKPATRPTQEVLVIRVHEASRLIGYLSEAGVTGNPQTASWFDREEAENLIADNRYSHPECQFSAVAVQVQAPTQKQGAPRTA